MDNAPLFEREHRNDSQQVQRLQTDLAEARRLTESQAARLRDLEAVVDDLERRLELESNELITLDAQKAEDERKWEEERQQLKGEVETWQQRFEDESRRRANIDERLRRSERELYRMHQKKYQIERDVRREETEKRRHEAEIVRSLEKDSLEQAQRRANSSHNIARNVDLTENPKEVEPASIRRRQALSAAMDFFNV